MKTRLNTLVAAIALIATGFAATAPSLAEAGPIIRLSPEQMNKFRPQLVMPGGGGGPTLPGGPGGFAPTPMPTDPGVGPEPEDDGFDEAEEDRRDRRDRRRARREEMIGGIIGLAIGAAAANAANNRASGGSSNAQIDQCVATAQNQGQTLETALPLCYCMFAQPKPAGC